MKTILFIGAGPAQAVGIALGKQLGFRVLAVDRNPDAVGFAVADQQIITDVTDIATIVEKASRLKPDGCLSIASEICLPAVAAVNQTLDLPGIRPDEVDLATNKAKMRSRLKEYGIPGPDFAVLKAENELADALERVGLPAVIKPVDNAGSRGVTYIETKDNAMAAYCRARRYSRNGGVLLEAFMPGREVSVEAFVVDGTVNILAMSDKDRTSPPSMLDTRVVFPARWPTEIERNIKEVASNAMLATGINDSPFHVEIMVTPDGPKMVELGARGPGFKVYTDIIPFVSGVNPVEVQLKLLFGQPVDLTPHRDGYGACLQFFGSDRSGTVAEVITSDLASAPEVADYKIYLDSGDPVNQLSCGDDRLGHIITLAANRDIAVNLAQDIHENTKIRVS